MFEEALGRSIPPDAFTSGSTFDKLSHTRGPLYMKHIDIGPVQLDPPSDAQGVLRSMTPRIS